MMDVLSHYEGRRIQRTICLRHTHGPSNDPADSPRLAVLAVFSASPRHSPDHPFQDRNRVLQLLDWNISYL